MRQPDLTGDGPLGGDLFTRPNSRRWSRHFGTLAIALGVLMAVAVAGCGTPQRPHHPLTPPSGPAIHLAVPPPTMAEHQTWLLTAQALREMAALKPVIAALKSATILELVGPSGTLYPGLPASEVMSFRSESEFARWRPGRGSPSPRAVLYDPEHWAYTPLAEQQDVEVYASRFVTLARSRSETPILAPGLDLVEALGHGSGSLATRYLTQEIPRAMAQALGGGPGVLEIQAQSQERSVSAYRSLVAGALAQIRGITSSAEVLAGLSTNPQGGPVTAAELEADVRATEGLVSGYWLNVPGPGPSCPACAAANPQLGADVLQAIQ